MNTERNLLFGVLARKANLISAPQLNDACRATADQPNTALGDVLVAQGQITVKQKQELEAAMDRELSNRGGDCLATLHANLEPEVVKSLAAIDEPTVQKSIANILLPPAVASPAQSERLQQLFTGQPAPLRESGERYERLRMHAAGGIGRIWLARDNDLDREVALKELLADASADPDMRRRFLEEARITGKLEHPGIVPIYELAGDKDGKPFYVMRFIKGRTLSEAIRDYHTRRRKGEARAVDLNNLLNSFVTVCNAIAYAHSRNVIHRDLKGPNVILGEFGEVLVLDWGLAKQRAGEARKVEDSATGSDRLQRFVSHEAKTTPAVSSSNDQTQEGLILGTPAYMPPEQAAGRLDLLDARSDVYSLGVMLYEILTGRLPFQRDPTAPPPKTPEEQRSSVMELLERVQKEQPPRPRQINPDVPRPLQAICLKAISKKQTERYASASELASDLQRWLADEPVGVYAEPFSAQLGRWARKHKAFVTGAAGLLITAVIALAVSTILIGREQVRTDQARQSALRNFRKARDNVDKFYIQVSENKLLQEPGQQKLREELLQMAHDFYEESVQEYGDDPTLKGDMAYALLSLARAAGDLNRHERALEKIEQAIRLFKELVREQPNQPNWKTGQARSYLTKGLFFHRLKKLADAEAAYAKASELLEALAPTPEQQPELIRFKAYALGNLGLLNQANRDYAKAQKQFEDALAMHVELVRLYPENPIYQDDLAAGHTNLGIILFRMQKLDAAEPNIVKALELHRALVKKINNIAYQRHLARSLNNVGNVLRARDQHVQALATYDEAFKIREQLAEKNPDVLDYQAELAELLMNIGNIYNRFREKTKDKTAIADYGARSERSYEKAKEVFERLRKQDAENPEYKRGVGWALSALGDVAFFLGKPSATPRYRESIAILEPLLHEGLRSAEVREPLRNAYWGLAEIAYDGKRREESARWFQKAVPLDDGRFRQGLLQKWANVLAELSETQKHAQLTPLLDDFAKEPLLPGNAAYLLARVYRNCIIDASREGNKTLADKYAAGTIQLLLAAEKAGYFRTANAADSLLAFRQRPEMASRPEFVELVKRLSK